MLGELLGAATEPADVEELLQLSIFARPFDVLSGARALDGNELLSKATLRRLVYRGLLQELPSGSFVAHSAVQGAMGCVRPQDGRLGDCK